MSGDPSISRFSEGFHKWFRSGKLMPANPQIDSTGLASVSLKMIFKEQGLALGTGFFWRTPGAVALVTAWHNFSGLHHTTRQPMARHCGVPDRVRVRYTPKKPCDFQQQTFPLYLHDEMETPRWFVHNVCGNFFDIAFLQIELNDHDVFCANDGINPLEEHLLPGSDVFAIGYPQGVSSIGVIPIWKRGSLASEIDLPTEGHPKFLIDIAGRGGLSGAPVYKVQRGLFTEKVGETTNVKLGSKTEFLGLYSGRAADQLPPDQRDRESSDLGFVWRSSIVAEVVGNGIPDEQPAVGKGKLEMKSIWESHQT